MCAHWAGSGLNLNTEFVLSVAGVALNNLSILSLNS